jgi:hypothetical protein
VTAPPPPPDPPIAVSADPAPLSARAPDGDARARRQALARTFACGVLAVVALWALIALATSRRDPPALAQTTRAEQAAGTGLVAPELFRVPTTQSSEQDSEASTSAPSRRPSSPPGAIAARGGPPARSGLIRVAPF